MCTNIKDIINYFLNMSKLPPNVDLIYKRGPNLK